MGIRRPVPPKFSGVLPKKRVLIEFPARTKKSRNEGYAPEVQHPPGSTRDPIIPPFPNIDEIIEKTVKSPKAPVKSTNFKQRLKELRRTYYAEEMRAEFENRILKMNNQTEAAKLDRERNRKAKSFLRNDWLEKVYTLPTIDSYVKYYHPAKAPVSNTDHQTAGYSEGKIHEAQVSQDRSRHFTYMAEKTEGRATHVLKLYHSADNFLLTQDELNKHIETEFADGKESQFVNYNDRSIDSLIQSRNSTEHAIATTHGVYAEFMEDFLGIYVDGQPGIQEIEKSLSIAQSVSAESLLNEEKGAPVA